MQLSSEFLSAAKLKKKEVTSKNLRRKKTWLDKLLKGKRKPSKVVASKNKGAKQQKKHDGVEPQVGVEKGDGDNGANMEFQECNVVMSFMVHYSVLDFGADCSLLWPNCTSRLA